MVRMAAGLPAARRDTIDADKISEIALRGGFFSKKIGKM